jgi:hypothetical protein
MQIIEYNERSFAVIGEETKNIITELKELGGGYNRYLKCGAGWIFSNKRRDDVEKLITQLQAVKNFTPPPTIAKILEVKSESKSVIQKVSHKVEYTDIVCEGFYEGTIRLANGKVEKWCKDMMRARDTYFKHNPKDVRSKKCKFTFVNVK